MKGSSRGAPSVNDVSSRVPVRRDFVYSSMIFREPESVFRVHALVSHSHAVDIAALELFAGSFCGCLVEAGEARPVEGLVAFLHALGERIRGGKHGGGLELRGTQVLLGLVFALEGTNLDEPPAVRAGLRHGALRLCEIAPGRFGSGGNDNRGRLRRRDHDCAGRSQQL